MWHYRRRYVERGQSAFQRLVSSLSRHCMKRDIRGFPNWDWKISKQRLSFLNIARRPHTILRLANDVLCSVQLHVWKDIQTCETCLSNYVPDFDLNMQKEFSSILSYLFSVASGQNYSLVFSFSWQNLQLAPRNVASFQRAFWSLEPQAYLVKTYIQQKHAAKPQFMMHRQIIRPHFAVSTCCTVLRSHDDHPSWIQYEALFLLSLKSQEQTFYCSYLLQVRHISSRTCFTFVRAGGRMSLDISENFQLAPVRSPTSRCFDCKKRSGRPEPRQSLE